MSSTDFNTPPIKLIMLAVSLVVGLHVLTAMALVAIKPPAPTIELPTVTPPIEIQLVPPPPVEIEEVVIKEIENEPVKKVKTQPKAKPVAAAKPKVVKQVKPVDKPKSIVKKTVKPVVEDKPVVIKKKPTVTIDSNTNQQPSTVKKPTATELADANKAQGLADAKRAQELADAKRAQELADAKKAQELADAKKAQELADAKRAQELADAKKAEADAIKAKAAAAASNTPVNFTATNANWASPPSISFPTSAARRAKSGDRLTVVLVLRVNKQGGIDNVRVAQSSGNKLLDKEAQRQVRSGKFKPFTKGGVPVVGNVTLPIDYVVP